MLFMLEVTAADELLLVELLPVLAELLRWDGALCRNAVPPA